MVVVGIDASTNKTGICLFQEGKYIKHTLIDCHKEKNAMKIRNSSRITAIVLALVMLLPLIWGIDGVWISIVVAEFMAVVFSVVFLILKKNRYHYM